ncbi:unnamed protein product [Miscanthus lutarioriparius]|uniref:Uncharacterized protein n=1 Tax=Miscanthus lutarioriparius TaxID=422564 RepID=A0A811NFZ2_9POAL|nr:unnamed protein product [Miscanthus lutarioriparius]
MGDAEAASRAGGEGGGGGRGDEGVLAEYYALCAGGGMLAAGATHLAITPLDVLKVNMQGGCRFGLYEYFKKRYSDMLVDSNKSTIYFLSSASAQIIADVGLCPFESVKVRVQTQPMFAKGLVDGFPRVYATEGLSGFYRGLLPLWGRNLPFSMLMFSSFEHTVDFLYQKVIQKKKEDCSTIQQLGATCLAGYISGAVGTVVSNPADNIVSSLYNKKKLKISYML